jgi:hypothetical protein
MIVLFWTLVRSYFCELNSDMLWKRTMSQAVRPIGSVNRFLQPVGAGITVLATHSPSALQHIATVAKRYTPWCHAYSKGKKRAVASAAMRERHTMQVKRFGPACC